MLQTFLKREIPLEYFMSCNSPSSNLSRSQIRGLRLALRAARLSGLTKYHVGAALFKKNRLISMGWNIRKTHPKCPTSLSQHAEFNVMIGLSREEIRGATLFVARIGKGGSPRIAKPCDECRKFLSMLNLGRIFYTNRSGELEELFL